jgi:hypothetical protein
VLEVKRRGWKIWSGGETRSPRLRRERAVKMKVRKGGMERTVKRPNLRKNIGNKAEVGWKSRARER